METLALVLIVVVIICAALAAALLWALRELHATHDQGTNDSATIIDRVSDKLDAESALDKQRLDELHRSLSQLRSEMGDLRQVTLQQLNAQQTAINDQLSRNEAAVIGMHSIINQQLEAIRNDTNAQLDRMRETVDEKLQKTLNDRITQSFKLVNERLQQVDQGLGEMQSLAAGVGDLKRVLGNVKTRGILGEVQLSAILADILPAEMYEEQTAVGGENSGERVDAAVKLPVRDSDPIWLPIDAKFPGDSYERLRTALDQGDTEAVAAARKSLETTIRAEAKSISAKYINVPTTTNFAILFLPFEGLYAEVVDRPGLIETIQRDHHVVIAGPSTMSAILNSLLMSYQTFAFQQRADEIQRILQAVKAELPNYQNALKKARKQIRTAEKTIDTLIATRTNVIERKLNQITALDDASEAERVLGIESALLDESADAEDDA